MGRENGCWDVRLAWLNLIFHLLSKVCVAMLHSCKKKISIVIGTLLTFSVLHLELGGADLDRS